jgi:hypothetical protein
MQKGLTIQGGGLQYDLPLAVNRRGSILIDRDAAASSVA